MMCRMRVFLVLGALFVAGGVAGVAIALWRGPGNDAAAGGRAAATATPENATEYRTKRFPDATLDVCIWAFRGAVVPATDSLRDSLKDIDDMAAGRVLGLDQVGERVVRDCPSKPAADPVAPRENRQPGQEELLFKPAGPALGASELPEFDLWVFVYPQSVADRVGRAWGARFDSYQFVFVAGGTAEVTKAMLLGDEEAGDRKLVARMLARGLGLAGGVSDLRPYITGECIDPGNPACGPEIGE